ncbi:hypothetical protein Ccrd_024596 [Cynara cardunculus var. scolymus]|uniref:Pentatricopeptide repeat-containing protein n=1 Tax=Cynara cardunculus var. scolymus TaxID=59895 RepID=A0A118JS45_CYNCS|nr:hypothetical protein Ccrd_024596 [Cynara cardunculus var. scolymus]
MNHSRISGNALYSRITSPTQKTPIFFSNHTSFSFSFKPLLFRRIFSLPSSWFNKAVMARLVRLSGPLGAIRAQTVLYSLSTIVQDRTPIQKIATSSEHQWHRVIQVIKWMLSKGQGTTIGTYGQLVRALDMDHRAEEAHEVWEKKLGSDLHSVPWQQCHQIISVYYRNNMLERLVKLFEGLEAYDRKPRDKKVVKKVGDAYEVLGMIEKKERVLEKYKNYWLSPPSSPSPVTSVVCVVGCAFHSFAGRFYQVTSVARYLPFGRRSLVAGRWSPVRSSVF